MKAALAMAAVAAAAAIAAGGAQAITYGELDGDRHPNVGALVDPARGTYCSGTLIAPTVFLTAAHCGVDRSRVYVTFEAAPTRSSTFLAGTFHANPAYDRRQTTPATSPWCSWTLRSTGSAPRGSRAAACSTA